mmetsp:Transcript_30346/g.93928  ORF Transcript_30346/g.93928 Transcript_30346/m.93928 type:complete len:92 (-) Transcript_30346:3383-3658(-)
MLSTMQFMNPGVVLIPRAITDFIIVGPGGACTVCPISSHGRGLQLLKVGSLDVLFLQTGDFRLLSSLSCLPKLLSLVLELLKCESLRRVSR